MKLGYARVSTDDQNPALQLDALRGAGCERILHRDRAKRGATLPPAVGQVPSRAPTGERALTVWKLDRLGRSLPHLVAVLEDLRGRGVGFLSLTEAIDTGSAAGRLLGHVFGALAEFERALLVERTRAGIKAAEAGGEAGRKPALSLNSWPDARKRVAGDSPGAVARLLGVARSTLYKSLQQGNEEAMPISWNEIKDRALKFSREWVDESSEDAEAKSFLDAFFNVFGVPRRRVATFEQRVKKIDGKDGYIDLLWKGILLVEHKSRGKDLDRAYQQAKDYFPGIKDRDLPRYILVSDFARFRLYDLEEDKQHEFTLKEFYKNVRLFGFIAGYQTTSYQGTGPGQHQGRRTHGQAA